ncbi:MAG: cupin domain-containing protein [Betaproteobacteria bacterium]|jgi:quercetin dioxygenase-like cupin family protein
MSTNTKINENPVARTPGAKRASPGEFFFDLNSVNQISGGPDYSPVFGGCVEGDRMIVAVMRAPAGKSADLHSHANEQWIYILEGHIEFFIENQKKLVGPGGLIYIPADKLHKAAATQDADCVFFTCKDAASGLHGTKHIS